MDYATTVKFIVAMIIMMNPLGSLSIFLQLTHRFPTSAQRRIAVNCGIAMIIIMMVTVWIGDELLELLGITIASFRCAGGIILLLTGLAMLQSRESPISHTHEDDIAAEERNSIAIVPLALPIIIGPGVMSTLVIAATDYPEYPYKLWMTVLCLLLAVGMAAILFFASAITKFFGESIMKVITRIMGMLIMAIAIGMLASGVVGLIPALQH